MDLFTLGLLQKNLSGNKGDIKSKNGESSYTITDAVDFPVLGLNLYGKSVQDGTPTPETPVDIVSVGDNGFDIISKNDTHFNLLSVRDNGGDIITKQPVSVVGKNGETKQFIVYASGSGLTYQWWQNVNSGNGWVIMNTEGARQPIFTIPVAAFRNGYKYRCVVTDSNGNSETSNEVTLYVVSDDCEIKTASIAKDVLPLCGIPVESGGNYTDSNGQQWICDELVYNADGSGKIIKKTAKIIFNGSENWDKSGITEIDRYILRNISTIKGARITTGLCNAYIVDVSETHSTELGKILLYPTYYDQISVNFAEYGTSTPETFKDYLKNNPIVLCTDLIEPQEIELTSAEMAALRQLMTYSGTTNVSNSDNAEMDIKYCINQVMADYYPIFAGQGADVQPLVLFQGTDEGYSLADGFTGFSGYYTDTPAWANIEITQLIDSSTESQYGYKIAKSFSANSATGNYTDSAVISSNEEIDLTPYNMLLIDFYGFCNYDISTVSSAEEMAAYFKIDRPDILPQSKIAYDWTGWDNVGMSYHRSGKYYFDVSQISGKHYLSFSIYHGDYNEGKTNGIKIYKMTLV